MCLCVIEREREADRGRECGIGTHGLNKGGESVCERERYQLVRVVDSPFLLEDPSLNTPVSNSSLVCLLMSGDL